MISIEMRVRGGVILHIIVAISTILVLSVLCKDHFIPALHVIVNRESYLPDITGSIQSI